MRTTCHTRVADLPEDWDSLATDIFQRRPFLAHCERENPCQQRYYVRWDAGAPAAAAVVYRLSLDLLAYLGVRSPVGVNVVGVPCSVSSAGLFGPPAAAHRLLEEVFGAERGFTLALNLPTAPDGPGAAVGRTWPTLVLDRPFSDLDAYGAALRSPYRRRLARIVAREKTLSIDTVPSSTFGSEAHALYLEVWARSQGRLERLSLPFFQRLPAPFRLTTFRERGELRGFIVTAADQDRFWFFLGGQDHGPGAREIYLVKLLTVLRQAFAAGARRIDLGQTAAIPKLRLGAECRELAMAGRHARRPVRAALRLLAPLLSYRGRHVLPRVFQEDAS